MSRGREFEPPRQPLPSRPPPDLAAAGAGTTA
jgi:hypothetical protein